MKELTINHDAEKAVVNKGAEMSVAGVANVLNVTDRTIRRYVKALYPGKMENGRITLLNEVEVTRIKLELEKAKNLDRDVQLPKTDLEKELIIQQAMSFQAEKINVLQSENVRLETELKEAKPKIESFNTFIESEGLTDMSQTAKLLGTGRNRLFEFLRDQHILNDNNSPYQQYVNGLYFEIKKAVKNEKNYSVTLVTPKGVDYIRKILGNSTYWGPSQTEF